MIFKSDRLHFRNWTEQDRLPFREMGVSPEVMEFFPGLLTEAESDALVDRAMAHYEEKGYTVYAVDRIDQGKEEYIGFIGLYTPRFELDFGPDSTEIGWRTKPSSWGVGLATEGARAVLKYAFEHLELSKIYSMTSVTNKRSEKVMKKIGMKHVRFFDHPELPSDSPLLKHTLYCIDK